MPPVVERLTFMMDGERTKARVRGRSLREILKEELLSLPF